MKTAIFRTLQRLTMLGAAALLPVVAGAQGWISAFQSNPLASANFIQLATDSVSGDVVLAGYFAGTATFGATTLSSAGGNDLVVARRAPTGAWRWAVRAGGAGEDNGLALALDAAGGVVVGGQFTGPADFGTFTLAGNPATAYPYVARLSATGQWQWVSAAVVDTTAGRPPQFFVNQITAVALDARGEVFVAGDFSPRLTCGATTLVGVPNEQHAFFARLAGISGQWLWAVAAQGTTISSGRGLAVDAAGVLYAVGDFFGGGFRLGTAAVGGRGGGDGFAARLDPATGQSQWVRVITSFGFDDAYAVVADGLGCWVGGAFSQQITLGPTTLTASGSASNAVLAHLNAAGSWTSASGAGGDGFSHLNRLTRLEPGEVVLTGSFQHEAVFGFDTLRATGSLDAFVARYVAGAAQPWQALGQVGGADLDFGNGLTTYRGPGGAWGFHLSGAFRSPVVTLGALPPLTNVANTDGCAYLATWSSAPLGTPSVPSETAAFTLAPNPAAALTRLTLATSPVAPLPVTVLDALGRPVRRATLEAGQTEIALDVRGLPAGLYVVRAGQQTGRLVVE